MLEVTFDTALTAESTISVWHFHIQMQPQEATSELAGKEAEITGIDRTI